MPLPAAVPPRTEPAASEPSETEALPPAAAGSLNRSAPLRRCGTAVSAVDEHRTGYRKRGSRWNRRPARAARPAGGAFDHPLAVGQDVHGRPSRGLRDVLGEALPPLAPVHGHFHRDRCGGGGLHGPYRRRRGLRPHPRSQLLCLPQHRHPRCLDRCPRSAPDAGGDCPRRRGRGIQAGHGRHPGGLRRHRHRGAAARHRCGAQPFRDRPPGRLPVAAAEPLAVAGLAEPPDATSATTSPR